MGILFRLALYICMYVTMYVYYNALKYLEKNISLTYVWMREA